MFLYYCEKCRTAGAKITLEFVSAFASHCTADGLNVFFSRRDTAVSNREDIMHEKRGSLE